jgi:glycosyltransferase involved in cell wall biosynthesis
MKILFIHQNFPGQFKNIAPFLAQRGHVVKALHMRNMARKTINNIEFIPYSAKRSTTKNAHPWIIDFETKIIRSESCIIALESLKNEGFCPDLIIAHPGWGESLFVKEVFPYSILVSYMELYYSEIGQSIDFNSEITARQKNSAVYTQIRNLVNLIAIENSDKLISPTPWQTKSYPDWAQKKILTLHDGISSNVFNQKKNPQSLLVKKELKLKSKKIITYVNRSLEPIRGTETVFSAIPKILADHENVEIFIIGESEILYMSGPDPKLGFKNWGDYHIDELRKKLNEKEIKRIHFLGKIAYEEYLKILTLSDVHLYFSYPFVASWNLTEAMAIGIPIVASDTPPVRDFIQHDYSGLLVNFFDFEKLAKSVLELLNNESEALLLSTNAQKFARENFHFEEIIGPKLINLWHL